MIEHCLYAGNPVYLYPWLWWSISSFYLLNAVSRSCDVLVFVFLNWNADINSRFIGKGPIHKLLNQLAAKFDFLRPSQHATSSHKEKRNIYDMCPTFILNIHCPRSYYDIVTSDRSRISVEFKVVFSSIAMNCLICLETCQQSTLELLS